MEGQPVECHSGYAYAQRPTAVHWEGQRHPVQEILSERHTPEGKGFRVRTEDGSRFELTYHPEMQTWTVEPG